MHDVPALARRTADAITAPGRRDALRRRYRLVDHLASRPDAATVDDLAETLAAADEEPLDRPELSVRLVHVDLPLLEDGGTVAHDPARDTVRLLDEPDWYRRGT